MVGVIESQADTLYGIVKYHQQKISQGSARILFSHDIPVFARDDHPANVPIIDRCIKECLGNSRTRHPFFHVSLNPHREDNLSDEQLTDIARIYMDKMGYGSQPYIVYLHQDHDRTHIHILSARVDIRTGKKINDFRENERNVKICESIERHYGLRPARGSRQSEELHALQKIDYSKGDLKRQVASVLKGVMKDYTFSSAGELAHILRLFNLSVKEVVGEFNNVPYHGIVYMALDPVTGDSIGHPIKSSDISFKCGARALAEKYKQAEKLIQGSDGKILKQIRTRVQMCHAGATDLNSFKDNLRDAGIELLLNINSDGRITGANYLDLAGKVIIGGRKLGKQFAANALSDMGRTVTEPVHKKKPAADPDNNKNIPRQEKPAINKSPYRGPEPETLVLSREEILSWEYIERLPVRENRIAWNEGFTKLSYGYISEFEPEEKKKRKRRKR